MYAATEFQDYDRLAGKKRYRSARIHHHANRYGVETLLLQWHVLDGIIDHVRDVGSFLRRSAGNPQQWRPRIADENVFQQIAVNVDEAQVIRQIGRSFRSHLHTVGVVSLGRIESEHSCQVWAETHSGYTRLKFRRETIPPLHVTKIHVEWLIGVNACSLALRRF